MVACLPTLATEGRVTVLELIINFVTSFVASVAAHYICKWMDGLGKRK